MPVESKNNEFPITFKISEQRFSKRFHNVEEVTSWINDETRHWEAMNQIGAGTLFPGLNHNVGFLRSLSTDLLRKAATLGDPHSALKFVESNHVVLSGGRQGRLLAKIRDDSPSLYPGAFAALSATLWPIDDARLSLQDTRRPMPWALWMSGLGGLLKVIESERLSSPDRLALNQLTDDAMSLRDELDAKAREIALLHDSFQEESSTLLRERTEAFSTAFSEYSLKFQKSIEDANAEIAEFEENVRARLVLEAPTTFWNKKAEAHRTTAMLFGILFLLSIGAGVYWLTHYGVALVGEAYLTIVGDRENPGLLALVPLAFITLPTLGFAWVLRHVSRIIIQNLSLQADAQLRGTISNTYLALTSQHQSSPAELAIALNALFRPVDGAGHSEIAPPNIRDILEVGK